MSCVTNVTRLIALRVYFEDDTACVLFANEKTAKDCLEYLRLMLSDQRVILLSNLFDCLTPGIIPTSPVRNQFCHGYGWYGWYNLDEAKISLSKDGYVLKLPAIQFVC